MLVYYFEIVIVCLFVLISIGILLKKLIFFKIVIWGLGLGGGCMYFLKNIFDYLNKIIYIFVVVGGGLE